MVGLSRAPPAAGCPLPGRLRVVRRGRGVGAVPRPDGHPSVRGGQDARGSASKQARRRALAPPPPRLRRLRRRRGRRVPVQISSPASRGCWRRRGRRRGGGALEPPRVRRRHVHVRLDRTPGGSAPRARSTPPRARSEEGAKHHLLLRAAPPTRVVASPNRRPPRAQSAPVVRRPALQNHRDGVLPGPSSRAPPVRHRGRRRVRHPLPPRFWTRTKPPEAKAKAKAKAKAPPPRANASPTRTSPP